MKETPDIIAASPAENNKTHENERIKTVSQWILDTLFTDEDFLKNTGSIKNFSEILERSGLSSNELKDNIQIFLGSVNSSLKGNRQTEVGMTNKDVNYIKENAYMKLCLQNLLEEVIDGNNQLQKKISSIETDSTQTDVDKNIQILELKMNFWKGKMEQSGIQFADTMNNRQKEAAKSEKK